MGGQVLYGVLCLPAGAAVTETKVSQAGGKDVSLNFSHVSLCCCCIPLPPSLTPSAAAAAMSQCHRFTDCMHLAEPGCAVTAADLERHEHYVKFLAEIKVGGWVGMHFFGGTH